MLSIHCPFFGDIQIHYNLKQLMFWGIFFAKIWKQLKVNSEFYIIKHIQQFPFLTFRMQKERKGILC